MRKFWPLPLCLLASCVPPANAPSLASRAIESRSEEPAVPAPVNVRPVDAALSARITNLLAEVRAGDQEFAKATDGISASSRSGLNAPEGSEAWVAAQVTLSALEAASKRSATAYADLDAMLLDQVGAAASDPATGGVAELTTAHAEAEAIVTAQQARIDSFKR